MLSLAFAPVFSQTAMASHHPVETALADTDLGATSHGDHAVVAKKDCGEKSSQSSKMGMDCCDMTCSPLVVFANHNDNNAQTIFTTEHELVDAGQLTSRVNSGLKRPPRT